MKKTILSILLCCAMTLGLTACENNQKEITKENLNNVNNKIIEYFQAHGAKEFNNFSFNYIDEDNKVVVVGLLNNNEKEQERFKQEIINSDLIKFVKGEKSINVDNEKKEKIVNAKPFIKTYQVLNIAESNDYNYLYLTIRQFQDEEVQTIKAERKLCPNIVEKKNYEFTIKPNYKIEDNILSIFNNSTIISIKETNKTGLDQIQESIS